MARVRAVEHLTVESATTCRRRRSLQCAPLRSLLPDGLVVEDEEEAFVVLNIASVPRGALLDLNLEGPGDTPCFLLPRPEIARRQAEYLLDLVDELELRIDDGVADLLRAVLARSRGSGRAGQVAVVE